MKIRKTDLALMVGAVLIAGPLLMGWSLGMAWYIGALLGVVLASIAGYDAQARMLKMGSPGEDLLQRFWAIVKQKIKSIWFE